MFSFWAILVPIVDQVTKALIVAYLPLYERISLIPGLLSLRHVRNPGAAFGLLPFRGPLFVAVALLLVILAVIFRDKIKKESLLVQTGLGLGLGGAVGNMIDRVRTGYVTDFIEVPIIPIFNVADTAIVLGVALVLWVSFFPGRKEEGESASSEGVESE